MRAALARLDAPTRLGGVDLARGLAVIGMLAAHLLVIEPFSLADPGTWIDVVNGRSSILFAVLAGVSLALSTGGPRPVDGERLRVARGRILVRALGLWAIGVALILTGVPVYVILPAYAILFLIAVPLLRLGARPLIVLAAVLLVVMPFVQAALGLLPFWDTPAGQSVGLLIGWAYPFPLWAGFVVTGLAVGRLPVGAPHVAAAMAAIGGGIALVAYGGAGVLAPVTAGTQPSGYAETVLSVLPHTGGVFEVVGGAGFALAVTGLCVLLCRGPVRAVVLPLRAVGSMPLTAYTAQIVVWAVWAGLALGSTADLSGFRALDPFWPIVVGVLGGATLWSLLLGRGPLERVLAALADRAVPERPNGGAAAPR